MKEDSIMEEPCLKKQRIDSPDPIFQLKAILSDDLCQPIPLELVLVGLIEHKKSTSCIINELNRFLPLPECLQHLKRVRNNEIIICKTSDVDCTTFSNSKGPLTRTDILKVEDFIVSQGIGPNTASLVCGNVSIVGVASMPPRLRWQYEAMNKLWSCKFHPNRYMESLFNGTLFSKNEEEFHCRIASILTKLSDLEDTNFGLCVDPRSNSIVAVANGKILQNPVMHCSMVLVDFVARSQDGGAWQYEDEKFHESDDEKLNFRGVPERLYNTIVNTLKEHVSFGAESISLNKERREVLEDMQSYNNLVKYGPYLCTGYDVYLIAEPCLMCAMALLHSRVRRIFYSVASENGALETKMKLHTVRELNHHFEVFQCYTEKRKAFNKCC